MIIYLLSGFQLHPRLMHAHSLQADAKWLRVGSTEHRQGQQSERLSAVPLWESADAALWSFPRILHGSWSGLLELQLYGYVFFGFFCLCIFSFLSCDPATLSARTPLVHLIFICDNCGVIHWLFCSALVSVSLISFMHTSKTHSPLATIV